MNSISSKSKYKFYKSELWRIPLLFLFLIPDYFQRNDTVYNILLIILSMISMLIFYQYIRKPKYFAGFLILSLFYIMICISTIINSGNSMKFILQSVMSLGFISLIILDLTDNKKRDILLRDLIIVMESYVFLNLITILLVPDGLYQITSYTGRYSNPAFILGHRNNAVEYFMPLCGLVTLRNQLNGKVWSKNLVFVLAISTMTAFTTWSVNEILCVGFIIASLIIYGRKGIKAYTITMFFIISAVASAVLVTFGITPFVQNIIREIFKKSTTMSGRTRIWSRAIISISERPIIGHGIQDSLYNYLHLSTVSSCHNYFLDYLYLGGIIALVLMVVFIVYIERNCVKLSTTVYSLITIYFGGYFILSIATPVHRVSLFIMFAYFIASIILGNQINNRKKTGGIIR